MDLSPNAKEERSSNLLRGLGGGLAQWDDLMSWHTRQKALLIQSSPSNNQTKSDENGRPPNLNGQMSTLGANLISLLMQTKNSSPDDLANGNEDADVEDGHSKMKQPEPSTKKNLHQDLSIIPEVDEDTRTTIDLATSGDETTPTPSPKIERITKLPLNLPQLKIIPSKSKPEIQHAPPNPKIAENKQCNPKLHENKQPPPNSKPSENRRPTKPFLRRGQGLVRFNIRPEDVFRPYQNGLKNPQRTKKLPAKLTRPSVRLKNPVDCPFALSSLQLKKDPPKSLQKDDVAQHGCFTTWSHLLAQDPEEDNLEDEERNTVGGLAGVYRMQENMARQNLFGSPKRTGTLRVRGRTQEEDEESLAAYIALEQYVGDTSFCSTSSKVDRLLAKSTGYFVSNSPRRENQLIHYGKKEQKTGNETAEQHLRTLKPETATNPAEQHDEKGDESLLTDWGAEEEELRRKKMSQFTTGGIKVIQVDDDESLSESDPEEEDESESSEENDTRFIPIPVNPVKAADFSPINNPCDNSTASIDAIIENINRKVEDHLSRLCVEIETLQKANMAAKKKTTSLKKQVRKLEQSLATEHLAYERKLAEQRENSAKALVEEKAKVAREKVNFERFCREQKKKEPSPVLIEQVERLRNDMVAKEEKYRAERARARGVECNLRIQITNLRQENEKLKAENNKLKREKETAANAAKAKNVSNTKVINAIAKHLSKAKPQVTVSKAANAPSGKLPISQDQPTSKINKTAPTQAKAPFTKKDGPSNRKHPTIGLFPTAGSTPCNDDEWSSSDEEIDFGPETPEKIEEELTKATSNGALGGLDDCVPSTADSLTESETEARYKQLFEDKDQTPCSKATNKRDSSSGDNVIVHPDGSVERKKSNGGLVLTLPDGTQKRQGKNGSVMTVPPSGWPILVTYYNGDKLERLEDGTVHYFYAKTQTWQITYPDGREELRLPNGVVSDKTGDGSLTVRVLTKTKELDRPAVTVRRVLNEAETTRETVVILPNGDREIRNKDCVERRFQDGTVRFVYNDGMQKTIYTSGRIRVKDKDGKLLMDTAINGRCS